MRQDTRQIKRGMRAYQERVLAAVVAHSRATGARMEADAKRDARWTDRTSHARQGLFGDVELQKDAVLTHISHTMEYGVHLELRYGGRYAILKPTRDKHAGPYFEGVQRLTGRQR